MNVYEENREMLEQTWARVRARLDTYPGRLGELGFRFFDQVGVDSLIATDAAPLLHLPLWLRRDVHPQAMGDILEGTALSYAYVRILDNLVDEPESSGSAALMHVANALLWDALDLWRPHANARAWAACRDAWLLYSDRTEAERRIVTGRDAYAFEDFVEHAQKCALAEAPLYLVLSSSGDARTWESVRPLVHELAVSYGLFNDVMGNARDLERGAHSFLLAKARALAENRGGGADVERILATTSLQERFLDEAAVALDRARPHAEALDMPNFPIFAEERKARLRQVKEGITLLRLVSSLAA
ncbi:MAG: class 1 isoprenoid biosynthesis enzyme [Deltaproteobacteria bacterium]|nr:class 1 isoprenoid biosynthesis enzyme [Deltaproteobacteria bacterium]